MEVFFSFVSIHMITILNIFLSLPLGVDETSLVSPESLRTRSAKPNTDVGIDSRKPPTVS